jgi:hypothetical protein
MTDEELRKQLEDLKHAISDLETALWVLFTSALVLIVLIEATILKAIGH